MVRQTSALLLLASAGASTIQCDGNTVVIRTGKFSVSEDLAAFSAFVQQVSPNSTAACCTGNDYEAAWAGRWSGLQASSTPVGTASYEHTLMRVMTMTDAGLGNRVKVRSS